MCSNQLRALAHPEQHYQSERAKMQSGLWVGNTSGSFPLVRRYIVLQNCVLQNPTVRCSLSGTGSRDTAAGEQTAKRLVGGGIIAQLTRAETRHNERYIRENQPIIITRLREAVIVPVRRTGGNGQQQLASGKTGEADGEGAGQSLCG